MQTYRVSHSDQSKTGKARVYFDGKHDWKDAYYLGKTEPPPIGAMIEANVASMQTKDGKGTMWFLNSWKLAANQDTPPAPQQAPAKPAVLPIAQATQADIMRFVSNAVGTAIGRDAITKPEQIAAWAHHALKAAQGVMVGKIDLTIDDKLNDPTIPF